MHDQFVVKVAQLTILTPMQACAPEARVPQAFVNLNRLDGAWHGAPPLLLRSKLGIALVLPLSPFGGNQGPDPYRLTPLPNKGRPASGRFTGVRREPRASRPLSLVGEYRRAPRLTLPRSITLCNDLVVELASPTDEPEALRRKLAA